jgi:uncharacterized membrane protein
MAIGPVQLLVLGFEDPDFQGEIREELNRLRDNDLVRVIDALGLRKHADGTVETLHESQLGEDELAEFGSVVGGLIGVGAASAEDDSAEALDAGFEKGAELGAADLAGSGGVFDDSDAWDILGDIPPGSAALLVLLEHRWAIGLRDAVARAGGTRLASDWISPMELVEFGLVGAEEAKLLAATEQDAVRTRS